MAERKFKMKPVKAASLQVRKASKKTPDEHHAAALEAKAAYEARLALLEVEFDDVAGRYDRLCASLEQGDTFRNKVGDEQYGLLAKQAEAMQAYRNILAIRIELFRHGGRNG